VLVVTDTGDDGVLVEGRCAATIPTIEASVMRILEDRIFLSFFLFYLIFFLFPFFLNSERLEE